MMFFEFDIFTSCSVFKQNAIFFISVHNMCVCVSVL